MWSQRSRVIWASKGDCNTKFFQSQATKRFKKSTIRGIRDETNQWREDPNKIVSVLNNYYQDLFSTSNSNHAAEVLSHVPPCITDEMNHDLTVDFHEWEVVATLKDMAPLKTPRLDGIPPLFY